MSCKAIIAIVILFALISCAPNIHSPYYNSNSHYVPKRAILNGIEVFTGSIGGCVTHSCGAFSARRSQATCFLGALGSSRAH